MRRTILFVDDELINLFVLEKRFEGEYDVLTAQSAKEAMDKISQNQNGIDIIISDLRMPEMNGLQFINKVKPEIADIPCFLLTGYDSDELIQESLASKKIQYAFKKPFDYNEINEKIKEVL